MASNAQKIIDRYGDGTREESRSSGAGADYNMEYPNTKRMLDRHVSEESAVLEIGCGTGYYGMYLADKCKDMQAWIYPPEILRCSGRKFSMAA